MGKMIHSRKFPQFAQNVMNKANAAKQPSVNTLLTPDSAPMVAQEPDVPFAPKKKKAIATPSAAATAVSSSNTLGG